MNKTLRNIKQRASAIQFGLLRVHETSGHTTYQVKVAVNEGDLLGCLITDDIPAKGILNKPIHLIQKYHEDYIYISGFVRDEMPDNKKILSLEITKACWFVKKTKGSTSWLQQKYIYEPAAELNVPNQQAA